MHPLRLDGFPGAPIEGDLFALRDGRAWVFLDRIEGGSGSARLGLERRDDGFVLTGSGQAAAVPIRHCDGFLQIGTLGVAASQSAAEAALRQAAEELERVGQKERFVRAVALLARQRALRGREDPAAQGALMAETAELALACEAGDGPAVVAAGLLRRAQRAMRDAGWGTAAGRAGARPLKLEGETGDAWKFAGARGTVFGYDEIEVLGERRRALVTALDRGPIRDLYWFVDGMGWVRMRTERRGRVVRDAVLTEFRTGSAN